MTNLQGRTFIIAGPPCSGKGTQCKRLSSRLGLVHVSTGDIFRELAESGTAQGVRVKQLIDDGQMVPDDLAIHLIKQRLAAQDVQERGALLDGYPRTVEQAAGLVNECSISGVVLLEPENDLVLADRAPLRRMDPDTGDIYNLDTNPPEDPTVFERLTLRPHDQKPDHFQNRVKVWRRYIDKVLPFFRDYGLEVMHVDCGESIEDVENEIEGSLEALAETAAAGGSRPVMPPPVPEGPDRAFVHVAPCSDVGSSRDTNICVSVQVPEEGAERVPVDVCCVVDVSASMGAKATREDDNGKLVDDGLTILNLVQHAIKTVMCTLTENDRLSIVAFNGKASIVSTLKPMDEAGRQESMAALEALTPKGKTNLWDGLYCGMESLRLGSNAPQARQAAAAAPRPKRTADYLPEDLKQMVRRREITLGNALAMVSFDEDQGELVNAEDQPPMPQLETQASETGRTRLKTILLLTDGQPTVSPPHGHVKELQDYKDTHPDLQIQINTFGFGYELDSALLLDLAKEGHGTNAFIPHAVIMATCFVNAIANVLSTLCHDAELSLIPRNGAQFAGPTLGKHDESSESWGRLVKLGPLQLGQSRDLVVPLRIPAPTAGGLGAGGGGGGGGASPYIEAVLSYATPGSDRRRITAMGVARQSTPMASLAELRGKMVTAGYKAMDKAVKGGANFRAANKLVEALTAEIHTATRTGLNANSTAGGAGAADADAGSFMVQDADIQKGLKGLHIDVSGRMTKALNGEARFIRWGQHYIRALVRSHQVQICTNKMDVGLRSYGGNLFRLLKDQGEEIFKQLPAPTPAASEPTLAEQQAARNAAAAQQARQRAETARAQAAARAATMSTYIEANVNDDGYCGGGCFGPSSTVGLLSDGTIKTTAVVDIKAGDRVVVASRSSEAMEDRVTKTAEVKCVVRIRRSRKKHLHQFPSGLSITGGHPMKDGNGEWKRPRDIAAALNAKAIVPDGSGDYLHVYNFILSDSHILMVNDTACVTFGHGLSGDVAGHDFFGDMDRVVADLAKLTGWNDGAVEVSRTIRGEDGTVTGMC